MGTKIEWFSISHCQLCCSFELNTYYGLFPQQTPAKNQPPKAFSTTLDFYTFKPRKSLFKHTLQMIAYTCTFNAVRVTLLIPVVETSSLSSHGKLNKSVAYNKDFPMIPITQKFSLSLNELSLLLLSNMLLMNDKIIIS